jgi:hypothetical protein
MRELRAGHLAVEGDSMLPEGALARIASSIRYPDGSSCTDPGETTPLAVLTGSQARTAARFVLGGDDDYEQPSDSLRTECQGPSQDDVLGSSAPLAAGSLPVSALGRQALDLKLTATGRFSTGAYTGVRSGEIGLHLVHKRTGVRVERFKIAGGELVQ